MPKWNLNLISATIVIWTWNLVWMETSLDAYNSEGQFKVTCGHLRTRSYSLSLLTLVDGVTLDANNSEGQFKVTCGSPKVK